MELEQMVTEVKKVGENRIIVEFNNGCAVAYEKMPIRKQKVIDKNKTGTNSCRIVYGSPSPTQQYVNCFDIEHQMSADFTSEMYKLVEKPTNAERKVAELEAAMKNYYSEMVKPLDIQPHKYRLWKEYACMARDVLIAPFYNAYHAMQVFRNKLFRRPGDNDIIESLLDLLIIVPLGIYLIAGCVKDIVSPANIAYKIRNKKLFTKGMTGDAAVLFPYELSHESEASPERFRTLQLLFSDGLTANESGAYYCPDDNAHTFMRAVNKLDYTTAKWFVPVNTNIKEQLSSLIKQRDVIEKNWQNFTKQLNKENQTALLKSIGFIQ